MKIDRIDHVSINVNDLSEAKVFFLDLGLEVQAEWELDGEQLDRIVGLNGVKTACVGLGMPDGQTWIELVKFYTPSDEKDIQQPFANTLGIRHICFAVENIEAIVAKLKKRVRKSLVRYSNMRKAISYATFVVRRVLFWSWRRNSDKY
ncbi:VOC family protein [Fredinandcohnia sp. QZ13]|uniref:VOC family protein n=1 Tax=Fredinandcohnia sp. QZ13 TaxID=3073144 RepID=UPI0037BE6B06